MPERLECEVLQKARYINTLTFTFFTFSHFEFTTQLQRLKGWRFSLMVTRWSRSTLGPVSAWMGDRLRAGKLSRYVTSHPGQLSLAIPLWVGEMSTG